MIILLVGTYALLSSKLVRSRSTWCRIHLWPLVVPSLQLRMLQPRSLGDFKSRSPSDSVSNLYLENVIKKVKIVFFHTWFVIVTIAFQPHACHMLITPSLKRHEAETPFCLRGQVSDVMVIPLTYLLLFCSISTSVRTYPPQCLNHVDQSSPDSSDTKAFVTALSTPSDTSPSDRLKQPECQELYVTMSKVCGIVCMCLQWLINV